MIAQLKSKQSLPINIMYSNYFSSKTSQTVARSLLFSTCNTINVSVIASVPFVSPQILHFGRMELNSLRDIILQQFHQ